MIPDRKFPAPYVKKTAVVSTIILLLALAALSCKEKIADSPLANKTPKSFLWLYPDTSATLHEGVSRQHLHWWGEDPDGNVRGYLFAFVPNSASRIPSPDNLQYSWVVKTDSVVQFPLDTLFRYFTVFVRAVDNTFPGLDSSYTIVLDPYPFVDKNRNGLFDAGDWQIPSIAGALDPQGAVLALPIRNTPPHIAFLPNPNNGQGLRQPDFTYTVATFGFKGTDDDGDNTLQSYSIALNDSSAGASWLTIPVRDTIITLVLPRGRSDSANAGDVRPADVYGGSNFLNRRYLGQLQGMRLDANNVFYVKSRDVAGESSPALSMPSAGLQWFVKKPRGKLLLISDYTRNDGVAALAAYRAALAAADPQFATVDTLNIASGLDGVSKSNGVLSTMVPPFIDPALIRTFLLYDYVCWYTDEYPSLAIAQLTLFRYLQNGGKVLFSTTFSNAIDPRGALRDFAPIDSIASVDLAGVHPLPSAGDNRVPGGYILFADSSDPGNIYPQLALNNPPSAHVIFMRDVYKRSDARVIYRLQADQRSPRRYVAVDPSHSGDTLRPKIGIVDGQGTIAFFGMPLHLLNNTTAGNPEGITALFRKLFTQHFRASHKIDRRKF
jgi:hypothetical protein